MKKYKFWTLLFFMLVSHFCYGQRDSASGFKLEPKYKILYIITSPGKNAIATLNFFINAKDIDSIYSIPSTKSIDICKIMNVSQIWVIRPTLLTTLFNLNDIFIRYNIDNSNQRLPVRVNNWIIDEQETLIIEESEIINVQVIDNLGYRFISIQTRHPLEYRSKNK